MKIMAITSIHKGIGGDERRCIRFGIRLMASIGNVLPNVRHQSPSVSEVDWMAWLGVFLVPQA